MMNPGFTIADIPISAAQFWTFMGCVILALGAWKLALGIQVDRKKLAEKKHDAPQPFIVQAKVEYVEETEFKTFEKYVHDRQHELSGKLQAMLLSGEERDQSLALLEERSKTVTEQISTLSTRMDAGFKEVDVKRSVSIGNLHGQIKGAEIKLAAVEQETKMNSHKLDSIDTKLDRLIERNTRTDKK